MSEKRDSYASTQKPANGAGVTVDIKRLQAGDPRDADAADSKVGRLFEQLGGSGKIKVKRIRDDGVESYSCTLDVTEGLTEELEEQIGKRCGAGEYRLMGFHKANYVASAYISIDARAFAEKQTESERKRDGDRTPQSQGAPQMDLAAILLQQQQQAETMRAEMQRSQHQMLATIITVQENAQTRLASTMAAFAPGVGGGGGIGGGLAQIKDIAQLFNSFGLLKMPGEGSSSERSFGEELLIGPLKSLAEKVGERVGEAISKQAAQQQAPSAPLALPAGPQMVPQATQAVPRGAPADFMQKPPRTAEVKLPPGVRAVSRDEWAKMKAQGAGGRPVAGSGPVKVETHRAAPSVKEAVPGALMKP